jgi:hypothetical protein
VGQLQAEFGVKTGLSHPEAGLGHPMAAGMGVGIAVQKQW